MSPKRTCLLTDDLTPIIKLLSDYSKMNDNANRRFSLLSLMVALTVVAIGLALLTNFGPLSAVVATLAIIAFAAICYRYLADWNSFAVRKQLLAIVMTTLCGFIVFGFSAVLWMQTQVQSNRLTTVYRSHSGSRELNVSVFRRKGTLVTVSGSLPSRKSFDELRTQIFLDFSDQPFVVIRWNVTINSETIEGADRELFPDDYDSDNRRITM